MIRGSASTVDCLVAESCSSMITFCMPTAGLSSVAMAAVSSASCTDPSPQEASQS